MMIDWSDRDAGPIGVAVAQLGGPRNLDEVEPFIRRIFLDPDTVPLRGGRAVRTAFGYGVARLRAPSVRRNYRLIGSGSPILPITERQSHLLEDALRRRTQRDVFTAVAMRNARPDTNDAVAYLQRCSVSRLIMLPLYPQYSEATTGSSYKVLSEVLRHDAPHLPVTLVHDWFDHPAYIAFQARLIEQSLDQLPADARRETVLLFSAHGLPTRLIEAGDPYQRQTEATVEALVRALGWSNEHRLAYQSRTGPVDWIGPGTEEIIDELAAEGFRSIVVVPVSFVSDHIETLYELDILFRERAEAAGITSYTVVPAMNDSPGVGDLLASVLLDATG